MFQQLLDGQPLQRIAALQAVVDHALHLAALAFGTLSVAAPFLILQPGMGAGLAASKTPAPGKARLRSLVAHSVFGAGMYLSALLLAAIRAG
nr:DUF2938 family protein [Stenotrophomonas maltophilia]